MRGPLNDYTQVRFGRLVALEFKGRASDSKKSPLWLCQCDCGRQETFLQKYLTARRATQCSECNRPACEVCGKKIPKEHGSKTTCSEACATIRRRERWRSEYYERIERDPYLNSRQWQRKQARRADDPAFDQRQCDHEQRALERRREKRRTDEEWAAIDRARSKARYEANRDEILGKRRLRRRMDPEHAKAKRAQERGYYQRHRRARLEQRRAFWQALSGEEKQRRIEKKRSAQRVEKRRQMIDLRRDPQAYREFLAQQREWERNRQLRRLFANLEKLEDVTDE